MCKKEKEFLKFHGDRYTKNRLRIAFKTIRNVFDKQLRLSERTYKRSLSINVESVCTQNPKAFWDHIKHLGPKRTGTVPLEVYDEDQNVNSDEDFVFQTWSKEFENLYNPGENSENFDNQFYERILNDKLFLEDCMLDPLFEENANLNISITRAEVEKVVRCAKKW